MKNILVIASCFCILVCTAQSGVQNSGNMRIHGNGQMGIHTDLTNNGAFDNNQGLIGFYGNEMRNVSGTLSPQFQDVEILVDNGLFLNNSIFVINNTNFVIGDILTPKNDPTVYFNFEQDAFFTGESDASKINGYAAITNKQFISFPVGDDTLLRPLLLDSEGVNNFAQCAYFFENPGNPQSLSEQFDTDNRVRDIGDISANEFWVLQGDVPSKITISWNERSDLSLIANTPEDLIIVGWNKSVGQWVVLGNSAFGGDITQGFMTSDTFVPSDFAAITFGTIPLPLDTFAVNNPSLGEYFLSPNGDGVNDVLIIDGLEESPNNEVYIFNRFGQKVFEKVNYTNEFGGVSNMGNLVINQDVGLPEGIYYYIANLIDLELQYQGFLFLDR